MALEALEFRKQIDERNKALDKNIKALAELAKREEALKLRIADAATDEERASVEADIDVFNRDKEQTETENANIREAIANLEKELDEAEKNQPSNAKEKFEREVSHMEIETRNTPEYGKAFVNYIITGKDDECRSLLSENVSGTVPVPEFLETTIKNAWEECKLMSLVKHTSYKGNVKVGFELSATGAVVHTEGTDAPTEEVLTWGSVELKAESIKKWITISDEAIEGTTIDTLGEIYKEIAQRIVEKAEEVLIGKIEAAPAASTATACAVPVYSASTIAVDTITMALAELSAKAQHVTLTMNRRTYAAFKSVAKKANFNMDVFDGCSVVFSDAIPAFASASSGDTYVIAGDFGYGFQANFPNGHQVSIKVDDVSLAEKDLVKLVGREFVGMGVVAPKAFVKIQK